MYHYPSGETRLLISSAHRGTLFFRPPGTIRTARLLPGNGIATARDVQLLDAEGSPWAGRDDFLPVGLSLTRDAASGEDRLYVINLGGESNSIEVFAIDRADPNQLIWRRTLTDPLLDIPNDLLALPDGRVYITNMFNTENSLILYTGAESGKRPWRNPGAPAMTFANGIAANRTGARLYVADFHSKRLFVLSLDPSTGDVGGDYCTLELSAHPDNLTWADDEHRELYIAAHTSMVRSTLHLFLGTRAPSRVLGIDTRGLQIPTGGGGACDAEAPVVDVLPPRALQAVNAASTARRVDERILVGQLRDEHIFECHQVTKTRGFRLPKQ